MSPARALSLAVLCALVGSGAAWVPSVPLRRLTALRSSVDSWDTSTLALTASYLQAKYKACDRDGEQCRAKCDRDEIVALLREILPPVSPEELAAEVEVVMASFPSTQGMIDIGEFVGTVKRNKYWSDAGELVVKELIYLDCLQASYAMDTQPLLSDDEYDELKDSLCWDGSALPTMTGQEAKFLTALVASRKGYTILPDAEYSALKAELQAENSWVASRAPDTLERLGLNTLLGYVHRTFYNKKR